MYLEVIFGYIFLFEKETTNSILKQLITLNRFLFELHFLCIVRSNP